MASAWTSSWGAAWGGSWGSLTTTTPAVARQPSGSGGVLGRMPPLRTRSTAREEREAARNIQRRRDEDELMVVLAMLEVEW